MSSSRFFNSFQVAVLKTRQSNSGAMSMEEARSLGRRLDLTGRQVRNWFHRYDKKMIEIPEVAPEVEESIGKILNEVREEIKNVARNRPLPSSMKMYQERVLETRFRQSSNISGLECHLIGKHFDQEGESIQYWLLKRRRSGKKDDPNFVVCPKIMELLSNINREIDEHYRFNMTNSQEKYLEQRFSIDTYLPRQERIAMSKRIGVPDYWIKWWFRKQNSGERKKQKQAALALNSSDSGKETTDKSVSKPSPASKPSDPKPMPQSEDWFKSRDILKALPEGKTSPKAPQPSFSRTNFQREVLETRFRQNSSVSGLESHLIGQHFDMESESIKQWFLRRKHSGKESNSNKTCPKVLEFLDGINKEVEELKQFRITGSQEKCLEHRFSIGSRFSRQERIAMSKTIGVPDYWIKTWFKKRTGAKKQKQERAAFASNFSNSGKDTKRTSEPSSASERSDSEAMSNSNDWFDNMATIPENSEVFLPGDPFSIPSSSQAPIERISEPSSALEPSDSEANSNSDDWFEKMATVPETSEMFLPDDPFSFPTSSHITTSSNSTVNVPFTSSENQSSQSSSNAPKIHESWGFHSVSSVFGDELLSSLTFASHSSSFPARQVEEPWVPRTGKFKEYQNFLDSKIIVELSETVNQGWNFENQQVMPVPNQWYFNSMQPTQPQETYHYSQTTPGSTFQPYQTILSEFRYF